MTDKSLPASPSAGRPVVSANPRRSLKASIAAGLTAGMVAIASPAVSHIPEHCVPELVAMIEAVAAKEQYKDTVGTIVELRAAEELLAASKAEILDQMSGVAEWTAKLVEIDDRAHMEAAAFSRCIAGG